MSNLNDIVDIAIAGFSVPSEGDGGESTPPATSPGTIQIDTATGNIQIDTSTGNVQVET